MTVSKQKARQYDLLRKRINSRFATLEKHYPGVEIAAIEKTKSYTGIFVDIIPETDKTPTQVRIRPRSKVDAGDLAKAVKILQVIDQYRTSSLKGYESLREERRRSIRDHVNREDLTTAQEDEILRFLGSSEGVAAKERWDSDMVIDLIAAYMDVEKISASEAYDRMTASSRSLAGQLLELEELETKGGNEFDDMSKTPFDTD